MSSAARVEPVRGQIGRFPLVGATNATIGLSTCTYFLGLGDVLANVAGYARSERTHPPDLTPPHA